MGRIQRLFFILLAIQKTFLSKRTPPLFFPSPLIPFFHHYQTPLFSTIRRTRQRRIIRRATPPPPNPLLFTLKSPFQSLLFISPLLPSPLLPSPLFFRFFFCRKNCSNTLFTFKTSSSKSPKPNITTKTTTNSN